MREHFGLRTIMIPISAVGGFFIIQTAVTFIYALFMLFSSDFFEGGFDFAEVFTQDVMKHLNYISTIYSVIIVIIAIIILKSLSIKNKNAVRREKTKFGLYFTAILIMIATSGVVTLHMAGIFAVSEYVPFVNDLLQRYLELTSLYSGDGNIWMTIIALCILVPISEELVFRGIIQGELRRVMPGWLAVILQAIIFALVHGNTIQISYVIYPAIILGLTYEWTKSIYVPIALHMIFNFMGAALPEIMGNGETALAYLFVVQVAMIPVGIVGLIYLRSRRRVDPILNPIYVSDGAEYAYPNTYPVSSERISDNYIPPYSAESMSEQSDEKIPEQTTPSKFVWKHKDTL